MRHRFSQSPRHPQSIMVLVLTFCVVMTITEMVVAAADEGSASTCQKNDEKDCSGMRLDEDFNQYIDWKNANSMHEFSAKDIHGTAVPLSMYKGFVCIVVNVASQCGLTDTNYAQLEELYEKYRDSHKLKILAFPCDQFNGQEPGSSKDILNFTKKYNVQFDMFEKVKVNGPDAHPLWKWLKEKQGGFLGNAIKWNFTKFIIDQNGQPVDRFSPTTPPNDLEATLQKYF